MRTFQGGEARRWRAWLRWVLFSEVLIWLLALAGPGSRYSVRRSGGHGLLARWLVEEPTFRDAVLVNAALIHVFVAAVFIAARVVARRRQAQASQRSRSNGADA